MAKQDLNIGTLANDGTGDTLRDGGTKVKANFDELYTALGGNTVQIAIPGSGVTNGQVLKTDGSGQLSWGTGSGTITALNNQGANRLVTINDTTTTQLEIGRAHV